MRKPGHKPGHNSQPPATEHYMRRRTLKRYQDLYRNPGSLFPGVETILFPNGEPEIWVKTADGLGMKIRVSKGPAGLGIEARSFVGTPNITAESDMSEDFYIVGTQYRQDERSQAFKRWYHHKETPEDVAILGDGYDRSLPGTWTEVKPNRG